MSRPCEPCHRAPVAPPTRHRARRPPARQLVPTDARLRPRPRHRPHCGRAPCRSDVPSASAEPPTSRSTSPLSPAAGRPLLAVRGPADRLPVDTQGRRKAKPRRVAATGLLECAQSAATATTATAAERPRTVAVIASHHDLAAAIVTIRRHISRAAADGATLVGHRPTSEYI